MSDNCSEVMIAVMGATGSGKSTFVNLISGSNHSVGEGLKSCTSAVQTSKSFAFLGHTVTLIDTPGFDDTTRSDTEILKAIANYMAESYQNQRKLSGIIYIHRISDFRMGGISRRNFNMFRKLCGDSTLKNVIIVTNMWGEVSEEVGCAREKELVSDDILFKPVLDKGARMCRHYNALQSAQNILRLLVDNRPEVLQIQEELVNQHRSLDQTAAGTELAHEIEEANRKHRVEMERIQRENATAVAAREEETRRKMERLRLEAEAEAARARGEHERLLLQQENDRRQAEARAAEMQRRLTEEARAARERQMELQQLQEAAQRAAAEQAAAEQRLRRELEQARHRQHHEGGGCMIQ